MSKEKPEDELYIKKEDIILAEKIFGLDFNDDYRELMLSDVNDLHKDFIKLREIGIANQIPPSLIFNPQLPGMRFSDAQHKMQFSPSKVTEIPGDQNELAFYSIIDLANLLQNQIITSTELVQLYLQRIEKYDSVLKAVITLMDKHAIQQAKIVDEEISAGNYRGLLHGVPFGAKDLLAYPGYLTTWGSPPYQQQMINEKATVIQRLEDQGAILLAKLSLGELAWGDVWFGGKTKSPYNTEFGSSGSSAGSASAVAAGLIVFAIGSETWGSIVSPSTRCATTGLRPTFGRVSRSGAMALSWSMDKLGPICRYVEDTAIVFNAIYGPDNKDLSVVDLPFNWQFDISSSIQVGYTPDDFEKDEEQSEFNTNVLETLQQIGIKLNPISLPALPSNSISFILRAEAAAAFDELTISHQDDLMVRQTKDAWPNVFRAARMIPAVEYIKANRLRYMLQQEMSKIFDNIDVYVTPSFSPSLLITNLTGHPCVVVPTGFKENNMPASITFIGDLYKETEVLKIAKSYQDATDHHLQRPTMTGKKE